MDIHDWLCKKCWDVHDELQLFDVFLVGFGYKLM